jgi:hypothetical protein
MKWLSSRIFKLNLSRFLPVGQLLPLLFINCTMFNAFFLPTPVPRSLEKSWKCVYQSHIKKRQKAGRLLSLRSAICCRLGEATLTFHIFIVWTHKVCAPKKAEEKPRKGNFLAICGTKISPRARQLWWRPVDTNLRKLPSRITFFKSSQVWI